MGRGGGAMVCKTVEGASFPLGVQNSQAFLFFTCTGAGVSERSILQPPLSKDWNSAGLARESDNCTSTSKLFKGQPHFGNLNNSLHILKKIKIQTFFCGLSHVELGFLPLETCPQIPLLAWGAWDGVGEAPPFLLESCGGGGHRFSAPGTVPTGGPGRNQLSSGT